MDRYLSTKTSRLVLLALFIFLSFSTISGEQLIGQQQVRIKEIGKFPGNSDVLEEWKSPGLYAATNLFDDNLKTAYAEGSYDHSLGINVWFDKQIVIDAVEIAGGLFALNELYYRNNRIKEVEFIFFNTNNSQDFSKFTKVLSKKLLLKDKIDLQKFHLDGKVIFDLVYIYVDAVYPGTKYNDTCISEINLYLGDQQVIIKDLEKSRKEYLLKIEKRLKNFFGKQKFNLGERLGTATFYKNGIIKHNVDAYRLKLAFNGTLEDLPDRWKVENSKLYMRLHGKWGLVHYSNLTDNQIIIHSIGGKALRVTPIGIVYMRK